MAIQLPAPDTLPGFDAPPVIETLLSVQFVPLQHYSNAHAGWFWKNYLGSDWDAISEVPRINDQFERFESDKKWAPASVVTIRTGPSAERHQITRSDGERMIQIQDSRFIYNWKKVEGGYPSFGTLLPEFKDHYSVFQKFAKDAGNEDLQPNQWEVTYVNHLIKGEVWESPADWPHLFPWLTPPAINVMEQSFDSIQHDWHLIIGENHGRLSVSLKHVRLGSVDGPEALSLQLTARGPIDLEKGINLETGFEIGHTSIVLSFDAMTSTDAHKLWKKRK